MRKALNKLVVRKKKACKWNEAKGTGRVSVNVAAQVEANRKFGEGAQGFRMRQFVEI